MKLHTQNQEKTILELSEKLGRNRGGIESKLMKFGLIFDKYRNSRLTDGLWAHFSPNYSKNREIF